MKFYIEKEKTFKYQELKSIVCDWCNTAFKADKPNECRMAIENKFDNVRAGYEINEFTLKWKTGNGFPESGLGEEKFCELCFECRKKLVKLLLSNGVNIQKRDWYY